MTRKRLYESRGYAPQRGTQPEAKKQVCLYLTEDTINFMYDFVHDAKRNHNKAVNLGSLICAIVKAFREKTKEDQLDLLPDK